MARTARRGLAKPPQAEEEEESGSESEHRGEEEESSSEESSNDKPLFEDKDGNPLNFFIHPKVTHRKKLERDIQVHGGRVVEEAEEASIILVDDEKVSLHKARLQYSCSQHEHLRNIYVEDSTFVGQCIHDNRVEHYLPKSKGKGAPRGIRGRTGFTDDDDVHLSIYIATRLPGRENGGRSGYNLYKDLITLVDSSDKIAEEYKWVKRHPWTSWRERYKKNKDYFDTAIEAYLKDRPPLEKARYILDHRFGSAHRGRRAKRKHRLGTGVDTASDDGQVSGTEPEPSSDLEPPQIITDQIPADSKGKGGVRVLRRSTRIMTSSKASRQDKGKDRAPSPITIDETAIEGNDSLFDGDMTMFIMDEAGPSGTQRTPSPVQIAEADSKDSFDSDDERIHRALMISPGDEDEDEDEASDSELFAARLQPQIQSGNRRDISQAQNPITQAYITPSTPANDHHVNPSSTTSRRNPVRRVNSSSREGSVAFPSPGTRARAVKDRLERDEKRIPYKPPRGTRAALLQA